MNQLYPYMLSVHIIAMMLWVGELVIINFVMFPAVRRNPNNLKLAPVLAMYRRVHNMSTMSVCLGSATGLFLFFFDLNVMRFGFRTDLWQYSMIISIALGFVLLIFHLIEKRNMVRYKKDLLSGDLDVNRTLRKLKWPPRISAVLVVVILLIMLNVAFGLV